MTQAGLFITGTSTEVGKTFVAAIVAQTLHRQGCRVGVYKPAASGCRLQGAQLVSDDAELLWRAAGQPLTMSAVCPQLFRAPLAPPAAAAAEGRQVDSALLRTGLAAWTGFDLVLVEGAGGLLSPLSHTDLNADLARHFGFPVVIVAANALGVINHTLLTAEACWQRQLAVAAVILNDASRHEEGGDAHDESCESNLEQLQRWLDGRCGQVVRLRHQARDFDEPIDWQRLAVN